VVSALLPTPTEGLPDSRASGIGHISRSAADRARPVTPATSGAGAASCPAPRPADETFAADLAALIHNADLPNLNVMASGFRYYLSDAPLQYPYDVVWAQVLQPQLSAFGAHRLAWGSDFPAARHQH